MFTSEKGGVSEVCTSLIEILDVARRLQEYVDACCEAIPDIEGWERPNVHVTLTDNCESISIDEFSVWSSKSESLPKGKDFFYFCRDNYTQQLERLVHIFASGKARQ